MLTFLIATLLASFATAQYGWAQLGSDIEGSASYDVFGWSVSMSSDGSAVAVGSYLDFGGGRLPYVRVYQYNSGSWIQMGQDLNGTTVSLSSNGTIVAVGTYYNYYGGIEITGRVRVYNFVSGVWHQMGSDIEYAGALEYSVSISSKGDILAIGTQAYDNAGIFRVYQYSSGSWGQIGNDISAEAPCDIAGRCLSLSANGNTVAINAAGRVRMYSLDAGLWEQLGNDIDGTTKSVSISADGSVVAVGAFGYSAYGKVSIGQVRVYRYFSGAWWQLGGDINGKYANDAFGQSVSISSDGTVVVGGANGDYTDDHNAFRGQVRIYKFTEGSWSQIGTDLTGEAPYNYFGTSVSLSSDGSLVAIGAIGNAAGGIGSNVGNVRVHKYGFDPSAPILPENFPTFIPAIIPSYLPTVLPQYLPTILQTHCPKCSISKLKRCNSNLTSS